MLNLRENPSLIDFQKYVSESERERGFSDETALQKCLLLVEEIGELFKVIRKSENIAVDRSSKVGSMKDELADVFGYVCSIANHYQIDLEQAFREKEEINNKRTWEKA